MAAPPTPTLHMLALYGVPLAIALASYVLINRRREAANRETVEEMVAAGLTEPASLHPVIDESMCIGCGACVTACPEKTVLGLINRRARLVNPTACIGHGACKAACPMDAITLVFGTEKRGVDLPVVAPNFETNVPGLFIAGELGGMGLIGNAVEQGRQAVDGIGKRLAASPAPPGFLDLVIVGAGPAGLAASLAALQQGLRFVTLEQDTLGGTVAHYPRGKIVMTRPVDMPLVGKMRFQETTKEALVDYLDGVIEQTGLEVQCGEQVTAIDQTDGGFRVTTSLGHYDSACVLLTIGRRGTPRKLDAPGEEMSKVVYRLIDPEQYRGRKVLVVGGGDSALEAALSLAAVPDTAVTLAYRGDAFVRAKPKNRERINTAAEHGKVDLRLESEVERIAKDQVELREPGGNTKIDNDAVIVCVGGVLPTAFLKSIGIRIETKHGVA